MLVWSIGLEFVLFSNIHTSRISVELQYSATLSLMWGKGGWWDAILCFVSSIRMSQDVFWFFQPTKMLSVSFLSLHSSTGGWISSEDCDACFS